MPVTPVSKLVTKQDPAFRRGYAAGKIVLWGVIIMGAVASSAIVIGLVSLAVMGVRAAFG